MIRNQQVSGSIPLGGFLNLKISGYETVNKNK
jgi:hypothetical protein